MDAIHQKDIEELIAKVKETSRYVLVKKYKKINLLGIRAE